MMWSGAVQSNTTIDFLGARIQVLRERSAAENRRITSTDEELAALLLDVLPEDWRPLLPKMPPRLHNTTPIGSHVARLNVRPSNISIRLIKGNAVDRNRLFAALEKHGSPTHQDEAIRAALEQWPSKSKRTKRMKVLLRGVRSEQWSQEFTLVGEEYVGHSVGMLPRGVWQIRVSAFFSTPSKSSSPRDRVPEVRVEILDAVGTLDDTISLALVEAMQRLSLDACGNVAYTYINADPMSDGFDDANVVIPFRLQVCFAPGMEALASDLVVDLLRPPQSFQDGIDMWEFTDNGIDLVLLESRVGLDEQPTCRQKRSEPPIVPIPQPGETFLLCAFEFSSVTLAKDGNMYLTRTMELAAEFFKTYGHTPKTILEASGMPLDEIASIDDYYRVMGIIEDCAEGSKIDGGILKDAVQLQYAPSPAAAEQPKVFVLMDIATKAQEIYMAHKSGSVVSFLDEATSSHAKVLGVKPAKLKVPQKLLDSHPEVAVWTAQHGVTIEKPSSGFDAGSTQIRLWNKAAEGVFYADSRSWWHQPTARTLGMFAQDLQSVRALFASDMKEKGGGAGRLEIYLPESMFFGSDDKYKTWRMGRDVSRTDSKAK